MCSYDDMNVRLEPIVQKRVVCTTSLCHTNYMKSTIRKSCAAFRLVFIFYLLISPVSAIPLLRYFPKSLQSTVNLPRHSHLHKVLAAPSPSVQVLHHEPPLREEEFVSKGHHLPDEAIPASADYQEVSANFGNNLGPTEYIGTNNLLSQNTLRNPVTPVQLGQRTDSELFLRAKENSHRSGKINIPSGKIFSIESSPSGKRLSKSFNSIKFNSRKAQTPQFVSSSRSQSSPSSVPFFVSTSQFNMDETDEVLGRGRRATAESLGSASGAHWMNPCPKLNTALDENATRQSLSGMIFKSLENARSKVESFKNNYAAGTYGTHRNGAKMTWADLMVEMSGSSVSFLDNNSGVVISAELPFVSALQEAYELMQRRAVGIEQVTLDQALYQSDFLGEFRDVESTLLVVLCDLRHAMQQSGTSPEETVTKDIMGEDFRDTDSTSLRNDRDTLITKQYLEGLENLMRVFAQYKNTP